MKVTAEVLRNSKPIVVCLCGSTRFGDAFRDAMRRETLKGKIVLTVGLLGHREGLDMTGPTKEMLDELHKRKIDLADEILVLDACWWRCKVCKEFAPNQDLPRLQCSCKPEIKRGESAPYIGQSTRGEIEYAMQHGKRIRYLSAES